MSITAAPGVTKQKLSLQPLARCSHASCFALLNRSGRRLPR